MVSLFYIPECSDSVVYFQEGYFWNNELHSVQVISEGGELHDTDLAGSMHLPVSAKYF